MIELLIVLALMAGLAGMALTTVGDMGTRGRYDETTARLRLIREAVVGNGAEPGRFLRDMGRLPVVQSTDDGKVLSELWIPGSTSTYAYAIVSSEDLKDGSGSMNWPSADSSLDNYSLVPQTVDLHCGWNGPYFQVNDPADTRLYDAFGNNFLAAITATSDPDTASEWYTDPGETGEPGVGDTIYGVLTRGSDGDFTGTSWDEVNRPEFFEYPDTTSLEVKVMAQDLSLSNPVWESLIYAPAWAASEAKSANESIVDTTGTYVFRCITAGTTGTAEPVWDTAAVGNQTTDNGVSWVYLGETAKKRQYVNRLRVAFFIPTVNSTTSVVDWFLTPLESIAVQSPVVFNDPSITPGLRKVCAYAFLNGNNSSLRILSNTVETVDMHFGANHVTLYLR